MTRPDPEPEGRGRDAGDARDTSGADAAADPFADFDEVTRAKLRLLEYAREHDAARAQRPRQRGRACTIVFAAFGAGVLIARARRLRRLLLGAVWWGAKRAMGRG